jgi:hypothetical protein
MLRLFTSWGIRRQRKELQSFIDNLSALDGQDVGFLVALATNTRIKLEGAGYRLLDPIADYPSDPAVPLRLNRMVRELQKNGMMPEAAAMMVWLHTMRAGARIELRQLGRDMWAQLQRGFPHVITSSIGVRSADGSPLDIHGYNSFPAGLTPDPLP